MQSILPTSGPSAAPPMPDIAAVNVHGERGWWRGRVPRPAVPSLSSDLLCSPDSRTAGRCMLMGVRPSSCNFRSWCSRWPDAGAIAAQTASNALMAGPAEHTLCIIYHYHRGEYEEALAAAQQWNDTNVYWKWVALVQAYGGSDEGGRSEWLERWCKRASRAPIRASRANCN